MRIWYSQETKIWKKIQKEYQKKPNIYELSWVYGKIRAVKLPHIASGGNCCAVSSHTLQRKWIGLWSLSYAASAIVKSVNLQYIMLGCLEDGTNELSTKGLMFQVLFLGGNCCAVSSHTLQRKWIGLWSLSYAASAIVKSVNLQYITLGCLDDETNESSTKGLMFQVLFSFILFIGLGMEVSIGTDLHDLGHPKLFILIFVISWKGFLKEFCKEFCKKK